MVINMEEDIGTQSNRGEFPPGMAPKMLNLLQNISNIEALLEPLISNPHHEALAKLSAMERAKVGMLEMYTINSLFWALMKTSREDVDPSLKEDYKIEMSRLKETQGRLAEFEARSSRQQLDMPAVNRFIKRSLGVSTRTHQDYDEEEEVCEEPPRKKSWQPQYQGENRTTHQFYHARTSHDDSGMGNNGVTDSSDNIDSRVIHNVDDSKDDDDVVPVEGIKHEVENDYDGGSDEVADTDEEEAGEEQGGTNDSGEQTWGIDRNRGRVERMPAKKNWYEDGWQ